MNIVVRGPDKTAASTTMPKDKYTESLTFSTLNCIYVNYGKLGKLSLHLCGRTNGYKTCESVQKIPIQ